MWKTERRCVNPTPIRTWEYWDFISHPVTNLNPCDSMPCTLCSLAFTRLSPHFRSLSWGTEISLFLRQTDRSQPQACITCLKRTVYYSPSLPQINFRHLFCLCKRARSQMNTNTSNSLHYIFETSNQSPLMSLWSEVEYK